MSLTFPPLFFPPYGQIQNQCETNMDINTGQVWFPGLLWHSTEHQTFGLSLGNAILIIKICYFKTYHAKCLADTLKINLWKPALNHLKFYSINCISAAISLTVSVLGGASLSDYIKHQRMERRLKVIRSEIFILTRKQYKIIALFFLICGREKCCKICCIIHLEKSSPRNKKNQNNPTRKNMKDSTLNVY